MISYCAEGQPEDISMMEILNTWLDALLDNMCTRKYCMQGKKLIYIICKYGNCFFISCTDFVRPDTSN